jgi:hypothetical protein
MRLIAIKPILTFILLGTIVYTSAQKPDISISTDLAATVSLKKQQRFIAIGQTIVGNIHLAPKDAAYIWYAFSGPGRFHNDFVATAKAASTTPQEMDFKNYSQIRFKHLSIGWKHYVVGAYNTESLWNLYFAAGFGLVMAKVINTYTIPVDTVNYNFPSNPVNGDGKFRRLTFDAAIGFEIPLGMDIYLYSEARAWIPASDYPSKYLFINDMAPFIGTANLGLRILFY